MIDYICKILVAKGLGFRTGDADGSDKQFRDSYSKHSGSGLKNMEIFLPKSPNRGYVHDNKNVFSIEIMPERFECIKLAKEIHPNWKACSLFARRLHSRNIPQVLGSRLDNPSKALFVCCDELGEGRCKGGTNTALNLAYRKGIPYLNVRKVKNIKEIINFFKEHL